MPNAMPNVGEGFMPSRDRAVAALAGGDKPRPYGGGALFAIQGLTPTVRQPFASGPSTATCTLMADG